MEKYFEAQHSYDAKHISEAFGLEYFHANSMEQVERQMEEFYQYDANGRPKLLEIHTQGDLNPAKLEDFFNAMK